MSRDLWQAKDYSKLIQRDVGYNSYAKIKKLAQDRLIGRVASNPPVYTNNNIFKFVYSK